MSMEEWKEYKLIDVCSRLKSGKGIKSNLIYDKGLYPVIGGNGLRGYTDKSNFQGECGIIGRQGAYCGNVRYFEGESYMTEHAIVVVGNDYADTYYLTSLLSLMHLGNLSAQSAQPGISVQTLSKQIVNLPSVIYQKKVSKILKSLDDKIEVNRRINEQLEELAQTLFKSWFVDFEPFKDGAFVESELGMIPEGWKVRRLDEVSKLIAGGDKPNIVSSNKTDDTPYPIYSNGIDNYGLYGYSDNFRIKEESVTVSARGTIGYVCLREEPYTPIVRLISIIPNADSVSAKFIYHSLKIKPIQGTGTTQQQLTVPMFRNTLLVVPPQEVMGSFTLKADSLFALRRKNQQEIHHLTTLRDTLLPKLMSGEIDVSEVEV